MREEQKPSRNKSPSKLLKVLVAAGMALGVSAARAEDKPASSTDEKTSAPADAGDKAAKDKQKADEKAKAEKEKAKKKAEAEKKASEDAGGVKGW
jgi:membrane protein involved in colicin uptake